ncbi:SDR family NAD(P)-dependent oxidoreductase [Rhizobium ruizarguesonis]|nr:SDR family NAD(P)-dependent oxidoreductase [Rhizobium ruizarguesonis]TBD15623.1 SDR family NAD(P)-dependent oxidoreductase [Rhizobium ruizarguesonis]TBE96654.1 SDR family NAD(P)-dependent oxidoreductase [Rhizobium ruizarguesonis]
MKLARRSAKCLTSMGFLLSGRRQAGCIAGRYVSSINHMPCLRLPGSRQRRRLIRRNCAMGKLSGKTALVTGRSSGIVWPSPSSSSRKAPTSTSRGVANPSLRPPRPSRNIAGVQADLTKHDDLDDLYARIKSEKGGLDIVIANAGMVELQTISDATPEHFDKTFITNARGTYLTVAKASGVDRIGLTRPTYGANRGRAFKNRRGPVWCS